MTDKPLLTNSMQRGLANNPRQRSSVINDVEDVFNPNIPFSKKPNAKYGPADAGCCLYGDAAYASRDNVTACRNRGVESRIKIGVNSSGREKGTGDAWGMAVREQLGGSADSRVWKMSNDEKKRLREEWKKKAGYGKRRLAEIVFSAFKRMFGEHLYSLKWKNMVQEVRIKVAAYNRLVDMGAGAV